MRDELWPSPGATLVRMLVAPSSDRSQVHGDPLPNRAGAELPSSGALPGVLTLSAQRTMGERHKNVPPTAALRQAGAQANIFSGTFV